jgi:hypothetical protein
MVNFSVTASDPEMDTMTYRWVFGDGSADSTEQNPTHTYNSTGPFYAFAEVNDGTRSVFSQLQLVQVGNIPVVSILTPMDGDLFRAGDTISFSGAASDPDESIPASNYSWDIRFFHNAHTHPTLTNYIGTSGTLDIETSGHDWLEDTGFEFVLTVTDSDGLSSSDTIRIYPDKVDITVDTIPSGIPFFADGLSLDTPIVYDTLIGFEHEISALSSYCVNGENYVFDSWSNGEAQTHTYTVPDMDAALTATYVSSGACLPIPSAGLVFHVEAGAGVSLGGGSDVTAWADQSSQANNLSAGGAPQLVAGALNGEDYVSFDGTDDILQRVTGINGLPAANADRTVYSIVNYISTGYGGVAYGTDAINEAFGLIVAPNGNLMIQGWGTANDFDSGIAGSNMGWMVQSAVHENGQLTHYQDGVQIDTRAHDYATTLSKVVLGAEIDGTPFMEMDVAGVFIYDRALDAAEKQQLESYIDVKYFGGVRIDILSPMEGQTVTSGDVPVMYGAAGTSYDHIHLSLDGGADVEINDATGSHTFTSVGAGAHMVTATLVDAAHVAVGTANSQAMVNFSAEDCFPDDFAPNCTVDTDGDGTPDSVEGASTDSDGDGNLDYLESSITDADGDGTPDQVDSNDADACIPSATGIGCPQPPPPPPPPPPRKGGGSFSLAWLMALSGVLAIRRRRYHNSTGK